MKKYAEFAGADNSTPSVPQYFSWINNTNEGSTEEQTLINLDFFRWLKETYGMEIRIYAWDAGNFDGASMGYGDLKGEKFREQYPEGYKNIVAKAEQLGIRMGLWGSPDGYGDTEEETKERFDFFVHLCKDYHFAEFKLDGVCGTLRPEKAHIFADMLKECRKYSPDLIVLNHRLNLYEAEKYVTTFLWNGAETYTDILICNQHTAMHHRGYMFERGHVDGLQRLAEDHGVCLSSCLDYFEDELIYQAFGRCLILAPEMYGNPWLLRDNEFPRLARVYNLHRDNAKILVNGKKLPESKGCNAISRGTGSKRYICTGNNKWKTKRIKIKLDKSIGLDAGGEFYVNLRHPTECHLGTFSYGDTVEIDLLPFRATLIEISAPEQSDPIIDGCEYEMIKQSSDGTPEEIKIIKAEKGELTLIKGKVRTPFGRTNSIDIKERVPQYLGKLEHVPVLQNKCEKLYETAMFAIDNDCLEARCIKRSGETAIPEVNAARDAFFGQKLYRLRGTEAKFMFDGKPDTFFDGLSKTYQGSGVRIEGGCLRIDFGKSVDADTVELEFFATKTPTFDIKQQNIPPYAEFSADLGSWSSSKFSELITVDENAKQEVIADRVHTTYFVDGSMMRIAYPVPDGSRYMRIPEPMDRIYSVKVYKDGKEVKLSNPSANNLQAHYSQRPTKNMWQASFTVPEYRDGAYIAVAAEGQCGEETFYCSAEIDGKLVGFPHRAPEYKANQWEHKVISSRGNHTFYLPLPENCAGKAVTIYAVSGSDSCDFSCDVYLCDSHR
ncbi:MAG: hypothetical protein MJ168_07305 [Clostridia bacterium]|nr:hypothetical protein [Clostridia bacterium]